MTARVYFRDGFACLYCGRWTSPNPILRLISAAFPEAFPYQPNWRKDIAPRAYWDISTTVDHIHAASSGGAPHDPDNLATACARCQYQKSALPLETLGWRIERNAGTWDGLASLYQPAWERLGRPDPRAHTPWLRAFVAARPPRP